MNWYIGQEIVCVKTHSKGLVKKGIIYTIKSLKQSCCHIGIDVGVKIPDYNGYGKYRIDCRVCGHIGHRTNDNTMYFIESLFAPLMDISELESILQQEPKKEKV